MSQLLFYTGFFTFISLFLNGQPDANSLDLDQFKWKNRLILISSFSFQDPTFIRQLQALEGKEEEILDRDLKIIQFSDQRGRIDGIQIGQSSTRTIRKKLQLPKDRFQVILIGKDGTVKLRSDDPVEAEFFFDLIDSMPMRRQEMKRKS